MTRKKPRVYTRGSAMFTDVLQWRTMHLLNIQCSPRGSESASIAVADAFLDAYRKATPAVTVDTLNVWHEALPDYDAEAIGAKYKGVSGEPMDAAETALWDRIDSLAGRFRAADRIVLGVPMWNFAYPYKLKQLIDLACQRNLMFTFDGKTFGPLLKTPRAFVVYARGQTSGPGPPTPPDRFDHQTAYIDFWLKFVGVAEVRTLVVDGTWGDPAEQAVTRGKAAAAKLAVDF